MGDCTADSRCLLENSEEGKVEVQADHGLHQEPHGDHYTSWLWFQGAHAQQVGSHSRLL
jgi:hypothetical protein